MGEAKLRIEMAKLVLGKVTEDTSAEVKAGNVISQSVAEGGEIKAGTTIDLVVSKGLALCRFRAWSAVRSDQGQGRAAEGRVHGGQSSARAPTRITATA
jgi:uncharacterized protein YcgI (DUF1989 family)